MDEKKVEGNKPQQGNTQPAKPQTPATNYTYSSTGTSKTAERIDPFAEQNKKHATKRKQQKKQLKLALCIGIPILVIILAIAIFIMIRRYSGPVVSDSPDEGTVVIGNSQLTAVNNLADQATEKYEPTYEIQDGKVVTSGNLEAAEETFDAALKNPANEARVDTIYLAQMVFYASISDNQSIINIVDKVSPEKLNTSEKVRFYNLAYLAYAALGDKDKSDHYYQLTRQASAKMEGNGG